MRKGRNQAWKGIRNVPSGMTPEQDKQGEPGKGGKAHRRALSTGRKGHKSTPTHTPCTQPGGSPSPHWGFFLRYHFCPLKSYLFSPLPFDSFLSTHKFLPSLSTSNQPFIDFQSRLPKLRHPQTGILIPHCSRHKFRHHPHFFLFFTFCL